jgi:hypothetical protein
MKRFSWEVAIIESLQCIGYSPTDGHTNLISIHTRKLYKSNMEIDLFKYFATDLKKFIERKYPEVEITIHKNWHIGDFDPERYNTLKTNERRKSEMMDIHKKRKNKKQKVSIDAKTDGFIILNVILSGNIGYNIDLDKLATLTRYEYSYVPDVFPGFCIRSESHGKWTIFPSGKVVITEISDPSLKDEIWNLIHDELKRCKCIE